MKKQSEKTIIGFKGFNDKLQCTPGGKVFQYEVGKEYREEAAVCCQTGFHFCEHPLDVFDYYGPHNSRFAMIEASGVIHGERGGRETKKCSTRLKIVAELDLCDLIQAAVKFTLDRCTTTETDRATGDQGAASATGHRGAASATGHRGAASATGDQGAASATGHRGAASATGYQGAASATGHRGAASATGDQGAASATGDLGAASATGDRGAASATGDQCIACAHGVDGKAKASLGNWIVCSEWEIKEGKWSRKNVKAGLIDGETLKPDTYYVLRDGNFTRDED
ncbi:MAG: Collagen triple helix repeat (20 copies) [bacterium ADurb.Bin374]|nr:MAG: Collagen triple helix repeat (20 copies) [bacterium ADurb.Bin374]